MVTCRWLLCASTLHFVVQRYPAWVRAGSSPAAVVSGFPQYSLPRKSQRCYNLLAINSRGLKSCGSWAKAAVCVLRNVFLCFLSSVEGIIRRLCSPLLHVRAKAFMCHGWGSPSLLRGVLSFPVLLSLLSTGVNATYLVFNVKS